MLRTIGKKRAQALALILILSVLLITMAALAATKSIKARRGGVISIDKGVCFRIRPGSLEGDTTISADMVVEEDSICFYFGPDGTTFDPPAEIIIAWPALGEFIHLGVHDLTLYGGDGSETKPRMRMWGAKYPIEHFSVYYFRRR
jgi:hypothetical protein